MVKMTMVTTWMIRTVMQLIQDDDNNKVNETDNDHNDDDNDTTNIKHNMNQNTK